jgi:hypothetical protein
LKVKRVFYENQNKILFNYEDNKNVSGDFMKKAFFAFIAVVMLCAVGTQAGAQTFQVDPLDAAIREASTYLNGKIPKGNKTVFLNITSNYPDLSEYILSLLSENAVNDKIFSVVDRGLIDSIRAELSFQMSGDVDDNSAQSIGKMLGAQSIVSGAVSKIGSLYRLQVKAIEVQTAEVKGQWSKNFPGGSPTIAALTATESAPVKSGSGTAAASGGTTQAAAATAAVTAKTYKIGDTGPAGGIIFDDKGNDSGGWRYLEAAPHDIDRKLVAVSEYIGSFKSLMERTVGKGKSNTQIIMREANNKGGGFGWAAQACDSLVVNGFNDWFLPSRDELHFMYGNLSLQGLGNFKGDWYWSSTFNETDNGDWVTTWMAENFRTGEQVRRDANQSYNVRACRQF